MTIIVTTDGGGFKTDRPIEQVKLLIQDGRMVPAHTEALFEKSERPVLLNPSAILYISEQR